MHVLSVVGTTQECVVMSALVASSVVRMVTLREIALITSKTVLMGEIYPTLMQWFIQIELHLEELLQGQTE